MKRSFGAASGNRALARFASAHADYRGTGEARRSSQMKGETVKRLLLACTLLVVADGVYAADFGGAWKIVATIGRNPSEIRCTLVQKRRKLTGTCKPAQFDPSPVTGEVTGSSAKWSYDVLFNGSRNHVEYEAVLGKDGKLSGTLHLGPMPVMFVAVRE
jgi:hypothetical protein